MRKRFLVTLLCLSSCVNLGTINIKDNNITANGNKVDGKLNADIQTQVKTGDIDINSSPGRFGIRVKSSHIYL